MNNDSYRISALGRCINVGDLYNYFDDRIVQLKDANPDLKVPSVSTDSKMIPEIKWNICSQQPDNFKCCMLNINSHLKRSIEEKSAPDLEQLWFSDYMKTTKTEEETDKHFAIVDVFLRVIRRTETLSSDFISSKMLTYQQQSGGKATHLVEQIYYGAEFICSIRRKIDYSQQENKEDVEERIKSAAKAYLEHICNPSNNTEQSFEPEKVTCTLYSSLFKNKSAVGTTFQDAIKKISDIIHSTYQEDPLKTSSPVEMILKPIPAQLEAQMYTDTIKDYKLTNEVKMYLIQLKSKTLLKNSVLKKIPQMEKTLRNFQDLIYPLWKKFESIYDCTFPNNPDQLHPQHIYISGMLTEIEAWLDKIGRQIALLAWLFHEVKLEIMNWSELESLAPSLQEKFARVFVLKINWVPDQLMEEIKKNIGRTEMLNVSTYPEFIINDHTMHAIRNKLVDFSQEADLNHSHGLNIGIGYYIGLAPANKLELNDGDIKTIEYRATIIQEENNVPLTVLTSPVLNQPLHNQQLEVDDKSKNSEAFQDVVSPTKNTEVDNFTDDQEMASISSRSSSTNDLSGTQDWETVPPSKGNKMTEFMITTKGSEHNQVDQEKTIKQEKKKFASHSDKKDTANKVSDEEKLEKDFDALTVRGKSFEKSDETRLISSSLVQNKDEVRGNPMKNGAITKEKIKNSSDLKEKTQQRKPKNFNYDRRYQQTKRDKSLANRRIAEVFVEDNNVSQLVKKGKPNVYLLKAEENSMSTKLRCFNVVSSEVKSSLRHRNHKVVILMGATGCGKSTLINGMVNYILGVQWNDPFRFKVVREDESAAIRNQANSQTSSVTAYTLEHEDGMTVPYSITIIDTPGYGDTRGVQRDKEITRAIHRFLSQTDTEINEIHAVCFVAASSDSRLTATQRYILDSVLSTFGKDVKGNIRLLVTFADSATPPVVEACKVAHFPVTSQSADIIYSKFNSSVLYASNKLQDDDFSFDKLFWDMGQENFQKFFKMLEAMKGRDLTSTREVIGRRQQAEWALKNIEKEVDICLVKIENIEKFQRQIKIHGSNMEANKNHTFEVTEIRPYLAGYKNILKVAYNCHKCKKTCEKPEIIKNFDMVVDDFSIIPKTKCNSCQYCSVKDHEYERAVYRQEEVKVTRTLHDVKALFESNYNKKLSTQDLLNKCSEDLELAKVKVLSLLSQLEENARSLDSTALLSTALSPADYLSLMRSRVAEEQKPGYIDRLETLTELQRCLAAQTTTRTTAVTRFSRNSSGSRQNSSKRT